MSPRCRLAVSLSVCLLSLTAVVPTQQATTGGASGGLVRSEMTLGARSAAVTFRPALGAENAASRQMLLAAGSSAHSRVRVVRLTSDATFRIGPHGLRPNSPAGLQCDLWLARTSDGWQLQVSAPARTPSEPTPVVATVPLSHHAGAVESPTFSAALIPTDNETGRLVLRWGGHEWTADVGFINEPRERLPASGPRLFPTPDPSAIARARTLMERNETALVLPEGPRLSVLFWKGLRVDRRDFANLASTPDGAVVRLTAGAVTRLKTETPLRFGRVSIGPGNLGSGFPGAYGLWLKRTGHQWGLIFNSEPDAWGTQHDPAFDVAEIELTYSQGDASSRPFAVALVPTAADRGRLVIYWGSHEWTADFVVAG